MVGGFRNDEEGSQVVLAAVAAPLIIVVTLVSMQFSYIAISEAVIASQLQKAVAALDISALENASDKNAALKRELAAFNSMIHAESLHVQGCSVAYPSTPDATAAVRNIGGAGIDSITKHGQTATLTATVTYNMPSMIQGFGLDSMKIVREVSATQTLDSKIEVS